MEDAVSGNRLNVRKIVITGVLAAVAILLSVTGLGFIPVPNISGNATILHVPAIIGGVMEGWLVGLLVGGIFGLFSFLQAANPIFANPLVSVLPRLFIGVAAFFSYKAVKPRNEYAALIVAGIVGTLTNTVLVVGMAVATDLLPMAAIPAIIPQAIFEIVLAVFMTVAVVTGWKRIERGSGGSSV